MGKRHGKATLYMRNGKIFNVIHEEAELIYREEVTNFGPVKAWFRDGKPVESESIEIAKE